MRSAGPLLVFLLATGVSFIAIWRFSAAPRWQMARPHPDVIGRWPIEFVDWGHRVSSGEQAIVETLNGVAILAVSLGWGSLVSRIVSSARPQFSLLHLFVATTIVAVDQCVHWTTLFELETGHRFFTYAAVDWDEWPLKLLILTGLVVSGCRLTDFSIKATKRMGAPPVPHDDGD